MSKPFQSWVWTKIYAQHCKYFSVHKLRRLSTTEIKSFFCQQREIAVTSKSIEKPKSGKEKIRIFGTFKSLCVALKTLCGSENFI